MASLLSLLLPQLCTLVVSSVLLRAAVAKLLNVTKFVSAVDSYRLLPPRGVSLVAVAVPWCEFSLGLAVVTGAIGAVAAAGAVAFFAVVLCVVGLTLVRKVRASCGCGAGLGVVGRSHVVRLPLLAALSGVLLLDGDSLSINDGSARAIGAWALTACVLLVAFVDAIIGEGSDGWRISGRPLAWRPRHRALETREPYHEVSEASLEARP